LIGVKILTEGEMTAARGHKQVPPGQGNRGIYLPSRPESPSSPRAYMSGDTPSNAGVPSFSPLRSCALLGPHLSRASRPPRSLAARTSFARSSPGNVIGMRAESALSSLRRALRYRLGRSLGTAQSAASCGNMLDVSAMRGLRYDSTRRLI